jgi:hypothetical protein
MPTPSTPDKKFTEELRHLSQADRARRLGEVAKRNLEAVAAREARIAHKRDERAKTFGQWVMIGTYAAYVIAAWIGTELLAPTLGYELAVGIFVIGGVFMVVGAQRLGERAEWWLAAKSKRI